jgi:hypothetical protein
MRVFDDMKIQGKFTNKEDAFKSTMERLNMLYANNEIKDILIIARTTEQTLGPAGLPQNVFNYTSVDTEYEATVFNRFASDMFFDKMKQIAIKDFYESIKKDSKKGAK